MALDLQIALYTNNECTNLFLEDTTGLYNAASNSGGYNSPNVAVNDITSVVITVTYTQLSIDVVYTLTVSSGTITAAEVSVGGAAGIDILADISTVWPPISTNPFNLTTTDYSDTLPSFDDMVYEVDYNILGDGIDLSTDDNYMVKCSTCCCISKKSAGIDINNTSALVNNLIPSAYLQAAGYANEAGSTTNANNLLLRAEAACEDGDCDCGCS